MRLIYFDIDSLRADHLGCYGYHRQTSPVIDGLAARGLRFENLYISDAPCGPSRTALFSGRLGIHTGVVNHGGSAAQPINEGPSRGFESILGRTSWMRCLRDLGLHTATISPFAERHSAWHWYANFSEIHNTGGGGMERADEIAPVAIDWIRRRGGDDDWFLHVNLWDPHTPYRTPDEFGDPFADQPLPPWYTQEVRRLHWSQPGPHSAQEVNGYDNQTTTFVGDFPRQPTVIDSMSAARQMFDGYDTGVLYADQHIGRILEALEDVGVGERTAIIVGADHGENLGELNIYGDHQTADQPTCRVPLVVCWPGVTENLAGDTDHGLHHHVDFAATTVELLGGRVPDNWDGRSFAETLGRGPGREQLVLSQAAWACQRALRFDRDGRAHLAIRTYDDACHGYPQHMLFDLTEDPHQQHDLAEENPGLVDWAMKRLEDWRSEMMASAVFPLDPMDTVLQEGGGLHSRVDRAAYCERLRKTGREKWADRLS